MRNNKSGISFKLENIQMTVVLEGSDATTKPSR